MQITVSLLKGHYWIFSLVFEGKASWLLSIDKAWFKLWMMRLFNLSKQMPVVDRLRAGCREQVVPWWRLFQRRWIKTGCRSFLLYSMLRSSGRQGSDQFFKHFGRSNAWTMEWPVRVGTAQSVAMEQWNVDGMTVCIEFRQERCRSGWID